MVSFLLLYLGFKFVKLWNVVCVCYGGEILLVINSYVLCIV